jgi:hypothetical protein
MTQYLINPAIVHGEVDQFPDTCEVDGCKRRAVWLIEAERGSRYVTCSRHALDTIRRAEPCSVERLSRVRKWFAEWAACVSKTDA